MRLRSVVVPALLSAGVLSAPAGAAAIVSGNAIATWGSGNITYATSNIALPNLAVSTTGLSSVNNSSPAHNPSPIGPAFAAAKANANLPGAVLSLAAGVQGSTDFLNHNPGLLTPVRGAGQTKFVDSVTVQSATLPAGTPVRVHLDLALAHLETVFHSAGASGSFGNNATSILSYVVAYVSSSFDGSAVAFSEENKWFHSSESASTTRLGLFAPGGGTLDLALNTVVGRTLDILVELDTDNNGFFNVLNGTTNTNGLASFTGALAFGASVTDLNNNPIPAGFPDGGTPSAVVLRSTYYNGAFPDSSNATAANALANLPASVVPEPAAGLVMLLLAAPAALRRRRA